MTTQEQQAVEDFLGEEVAPPEGEYPVRPGQTLASSIGGEPVGAKVREVDRGRWVYIYNTRTGKRKKTNIVHRPFWDPGNPRAWRWPDGTMMVSTTPPPGITPFEGDFKCFLHPDHPNREHYDSIGLKGIFCFEAGGGKENIPSEFEVGRHMKRHPSAWALIQKDDEKRERLEEREFLREQQREMLQVVQGIAPAAPFTEEVLAESAPAAVVSPSLTEHSVACSHCETLHNARSLSAAKSKLRAHMRIAHPTEAD